MPASLRAKVESPSILRGHLAIAASGDPSVIALKARATDPEEAATMANAWAEALVRQGRELYESGPGDVKYLQSQLAQAESDLGRAEADLADFEAGSDLTSLKASLAGLQQNQQTYLADAESIRRLGGDVERFRQQLAQQPAGSRASLSDYVTDLLLQAKVANLPTGALPPFRFNWQSVKRYPTGRSGSCARI